MFKCIYRLPGDKNILDSAQITKMSAAAGKWCNGAYKYYYNLVPMGFIIYG